MTSGGTVMGKIEIIIDGQSFPGAQWYDFVVVIIAWWIESLSGVLAGQSREAEFNFMDGPFGVSLNRVDNNNFAFSCWKEALGGKEISIAGHVEEARLTSCLLRAAAKTIAECKIRGWAFRDLDKLVAVAARLTM